MQHAAKKVMSDRKSDASKNIKKSEEMKRKHRLVEIRKKKAGRGYMKYKPLEDDEEKARNLKPAAKRGKSYVGVEKKGNHNKHHRFKRHHTTSAFVRT
jgi:hypothetical protein